MTLGNIRKNLSMWLIVNGEKVPTYWWQVMRLVRISYSSALKEYWRYKIIRISYHQYKNYIKAFLYNEQNKSTKITSVLKLIFVFFMVTSFKLTFLVKTFKFKSLKISPFFRVFIKIIICYICKFHFYSFPICRFQIFLSVSPKVKSN